MNVYRVNYFEITGRSSEDVRGQTFVHRHGAEKSVFVVAVSPEQAGAHVEAQHGECEILAALVHLPNVEVA